MMVRLIVFFPLVYFSLVQCHWHKRNGHNRHYGYGFNQYWQPNKWLPKHLNPWLYPEWNLEPGFGDSSEEILPNRQPIPVNQRPNYGYGQPQQNFPQNRRTYGHEDSSKEILPNRQPIPVNQKPNYGYGQHQQNFTQNRRTYGHEDSSKEILPNQQPIPVTQRPNYGYGQPPQNFPQNRKTYGFEHSSKEILPNQQPIPVTQRPNYGYRPPSQNFPQNRRTYYNTYNIPPVQNEPNDMLQALVDEVIAVDKKIKSICNRGHNPSEEYTEEYYKRMFNVEGYITETATVRIKHTVLYTCLDPVLRGWPCLEDVALLPENLNVTEAVYNIVNSNLIVKIPFKKDSMFMGGDACRVGDIDEKVIIVSKEAAVDDYGHLIDARNAVRKNTDTEPAFVYRSN